MNLIPDISIITVNFNGITDTCDLCATIFKELHTITFELIVVDNGSRNDEAEQIKKIFPEVVTVRSNNNLGFSAGNNLGIKIAKGKYILLLNNDTYITEDTFNFLINTLENNNKLAAVSPKIKFSFPPQNIQFAGYTKLGSITLRNRTIGLGEVDSGQYNQFKEIPFAHGAAMMINRKIIDEIGFMPEIYFLYYEEIDWCTTMTETGYKIGYDPRCTVFHKESQSTGQNSPLKAFYLTRNRLLFTWRHRTNYIKWIAICYQLFFAIPVHAVILCTKGKTDLAISSLKGAIAFFHLKNKKSRS